MNQVLKLKWVFLCFLGIYVMLFTRCHCVGFDDSALIVQEENVKWKTIPFKANLERVLDMGFTGSLAHLVDNSM